MTQLTTVRPPIACARALTFALLGLLTVASASDAFAAGSETGTRKAEPAPAVAPAAFKVVGYYASWNHRLEDIQWQYLTHVNYSFVLPTKAGGIKSFGGGELKQLSAMVEAAHAHKVAASVAVGGWNDGNDSAFEHIAVRPELRATFVRNVLEFVAKYNLDGVDIDWEYPDEGASAQGFLALMKDLQAALAPKGKILTAAVVANGDNANGIPKETFALVDFLNIMAYDADEGGEKLAHHSPYEFAERSLRFWRERGLPKAKAMLGVPFYGKNPGTGYRKLVARDPEAPKKDQVGSVRYNGIATMKRKTALAVAEGGGIMIWEISDDTKDETSLLRAIHEAAHGEAGKAEAGRESAHPKGTATR